MSKLKVPSVQHLARNWKPTSADVKKKLISLAKDPPQFSYQRLFGAVRDMFVLGVPYDQIFEGIRRAEKRAWVRENLLEILPLLRSHFETIEPDGPPNQVARRYYRLDHDIKIPFEAPLEYSVGGQKYFPWFSFWRSNPLADKRLSLFVTLVDELLLEDPDLDTAIFQILEFSRIEGAEERQLQVIDARDIARLNDAEKLKMPGIFADGYRAARDELAGVKHKTSKRDNDRRPDPKQSDLFNET